MILILGGTTEGRRSVAVCEEAGKPYYYSTRTEGQQVEAVHAMRLAGDLDETALAAFCRAHSIRLMVDAAHPFAENLHRNVAVAAGELNIPVVRFERNYPERAPDLVWFDRYEEAVDYLEKNHITNLLALTGVNTIPKLRPYWERHDCRFRILDRSDSRQAASQSAFPPDKILYFTGTDDDLVVFRQLAPGAILLKESGESGGFTAKVSAARSLGIPVLVVRRPELPTSFIRVTGENGLRKEIEKRLPGFFALRTGYTTGTCAAAAAKAALTVLLTGTMPAETTVWLPNGESATLPVSRTNQADGEATAAVVKDAGDDPDVTNGLEIVSTVRLNPAHRDIRFLPGEGVGTVTLPGLGIGIGEPAVNPVPRRMIEREIREVLHRFSEEVHGANTGVDVTISVPGGEATALKTFNPKLGIAGGISIIGTSGIVRPFSAEAFLESIRREIAVARALNCDRLVLNSGAKSERYIKSLYPDLPPQAFIHFGNAVGGTIRMAAEAGFRQVTLGIMTGKAVKLAEGSLDTHSKKGVMNTAFLSALAGEAGCSPEIKSRVREIRLARQLWEIIPEKEAVFFDLLTRKCHAVCAPLLPEGELTLLLIDDEGRLRHKITSGTGV